MTNLEQAMSLLNSLQIGACTCLTKTPDIQYHKDGCHYKKLVLVQLEMQILFNKEAVRIAKIEAALDTLEEQVQVTLQIANQETIKINAMQAKIDALMLEYCPKEMTPEQITNWGNHQCASSP